MGILRWDTPLRFSSCFGRAELCPADPECSDLLEEGGDCVAFTLRELVGGKQVLFLYHCDGPLGTSREIDCRQGSLTMEGGVIRAPGVTYFGLAEFLRLVDLDPELEGVGEFILSLQEDEETLAALRLQHRKAELLSKLDGLLKRQRFLESEIEAIRAEIASL